MTSQHQATKQSSEMARRRYASPRYCRAGLEVFGAISPAPGSRSNGGRQPLTDYAEKGEQWKRRFGVVQTAVEQQVAKDQPPLAEKKRSRRH